MKPTIHVFLNAFWRYKNSLSGSDVRAVNVFSLIKDTFSTVTFFTDYSGYHYIKSKKVASNIIYSPSIFNKLDIPISYILRTFYVIYRMMFITSPDYCYSTSDFPPDVIPAFIFKRKSKWIQLIHHFYDEPRIRKGNMLVNYMGYYAQQFCHLLIRLRADKVIVVNSMVKDILISKGFDSKKVFIVPNGVNTEYFNKIIHNTNYDFDAIYMGRIAATKGIDSLIEIWRLVCKKDKKAKLGIIGNGPDYYISNLKDLVISKNLQNNIYFLGALPNEKAFPILKSSKIFVSPSYEEGWGLTIAEASSCGVPSVVWKLPIFKEVFEDVVIQVKRNDYTAFSEEILKLIENRKLCNEVGGKAKKFVQKYDWNNIVSRELDIILNNYE